MNTDKNPKPPDKTVQLTIQERIEALLKLSPDKLAIYDRMASGLPIPSGARPSLKLLSIKEVTERLNVARSTVERLLDEGVLPYVVLRKNRRRVLEADLEKLVLENSQDSNSA